MDGHTTRRDDAFPAGLLFICGILASVLLGNELFFWLFIGLAIVSRLMATTQLFHR